MENKETTMSRENIADWMDKVKEQCTEINAQLKKKDYLLTVYKTGDERFSRGNYEKQVFPQRFYVACSLEEIPEYIEMMQKPFWEPPEGLTDKEIKNYPFEKKKWGVYRNIIIEPLSKELEESYLDASKERFFETHRMILDYKEEEKSLGKK